MSNQDKADLTSIRQSFIDLAVACNVLKFGEFELKSGRISPYFFNAGGFATGGALAQLGRCYAAALMDADMAPDILFGPAYKGIPLAATTVVALSDIYGIDLPYAFNRKEAKAHGEGGMLVGSPLSGRVVIIDDVITAGTAVRESVELIRAAGAQASGVLIGLDRCERGQGARSAVQEASEELGLQVVSVINMHDIIQWLEGTEGAEQHLIAMRAYRDTYGV